MKSTAAILLCATIVFVSCSTKKEKICLVGPENSKKETCIKLSDNSQKDLFLILSKMELYSIIPDSGRYFGKAGTEYIDTLGGGIIETIGGFYMSDVYYNQYVYNEEGFIKEFWYIDNIKPEDCIQVSYSYKDKKPVKILAINPHQHTYEGPIDDRPFSPDTIYTVQLVEKNDSVIDVPVFRYRANQKENYSIIYRNN